MSTSLSKTQRAANFPPTLAWNTSAILASSEFLQVKQDVRTLHEMISFQLLLDGCKHKVMIAADVSTWERSCVCIVDAGLEALACQDEVYLVVNLPIQGMPGCCPRQVAGVDSVGKGKSVVLCEL